MPLIGMVTDYTAHACWAESGVDGFAVACRQAAHELALHGIDRRVSPLPEFPSGPRSTESTPVCDPVRSEALRVLVTSGGFGVGPLRRMFAPSPAWTVSFDHRVRRSRTCLYEHFVRRSPARIECAGPRIRARYARAHGRRTRGRREGWWSHVSETLAAGRPMIVVNAIPGNEQSNEAYVVEGGAGVHAAPRQAGARTLELRERGVIASMGVNARKTWPPGAAERIAVLSEATANLFDEHAMAARHRPNARVS